MTDAYATIKVLVTQQKRWKIGVVVNQVGRSGEGRVVCTQLQLVVDRFVNPTLTEGPSPVLDLLGDVPLDPGVREAVQKRRLLLELLPGSPATHAVEQIAARISP
jgi:flagellar biosynthesis protein FlhG